MLDFPGTPGTLTALLLRISQCLFAAGSIASMTTTSSFFQITAFCYLIASMSLQAIWSFALACLDTYALAKNKVLHNPILVSLFVVGDWVTATMSLAAAASSAGVIVLYTRDSGLWRGEECMKFQISVSLAFFSWIMVGISSCIMLWIMAAVWMLLCCWNNSVVSWKGKDSSGIQVMGKGAVGFCQTQFSFTHSEKAPMSFWCLDGTLGTFGKILQTSIQYE